MYSNIHIHILTFRVEFENLTSDSSFEHLITNIEADLYIEGNILIGGMASIQTLNLTSKIMLVGGSSPGYENGRGDEVRVFYAFIHQLSKETVLLSDLYNDCIRKLNRGENSVEDYAGRCREQGEKDGVGQEARLFKPRYMASDSSHKAYTLVYILTNDGNTLRRLNTSGLQMDTVSSLPKGAAFISMWIDLNYPMEVVLATNMELYRVGVATLSSGSVKVTQLPLSNITNALPLHEGLYLFAGGNTNGLYLVDIHATEVLTICDKNSVSDVTQSECYIFADSMLGLAHNTLYIISGTSLKSLPGTRSIKLSCALAMYSMRFSLRYIVVRERIW